MTMPVESRDETRTVHDPILDKDVQISDRLVDRLRGRYACGPVMPNGEPEFGWREFETPPIQHEAATRIEADAKRIADLEAALTPSADTKAAYIGEFSFFIDTMRCDDDGEEVFIAERVLVPWDTVKEIMKAIRGYATAIRSGKPDGKE